jgi:predicted GNAT family acetyltransferase
MAMRDNPAAGRFELEEQGFVAFANYRRLGDELIIDYVESPPALRGTGTAGRLMEAIAALAADQRLRIIPICGYATRWLRLHPEHGGIAEATRRDQAAGR